MITEAERRKIAVHIRLYGYPTLEEVERGYPLEEEYEYPEAFDAVRLPTSPATLWFCAWIRLLWSPGFRGEDLETRKLQTATLERIVARLGETEGVTRRRRRELGVRPFTKQGR